MAHVPFYEASQCALQLELSAPRRSAAGPGLRTSHQTPTPALSSSIHGRGLSRLHCKAWHRVAINTNRLTGPVGGRRLPRCSASRNPTALEAAYEFCRALTADSAKTFYFATLFQPEDKARSIHAIYAWCRLLDETVDSAAAESESAQELQQKLDAVEQSLVELWEAQQATAAAASTSQPEYSSATAPQNLALIDTVRRTRGLLLEPFQDMVKGMRMDVHPTVRYQTFSGLYLYCYRVAGTVALMTIPVLGTAPGVTVEQATEPGVALGIALQLTNVVRDVGQDAGRGRLYLPLEDLAAFGVKEEEVLGCNVPPSPQYKHMIEFQIQRALAYYDVAEAGVAKLAPSSRLPVLVNECKMQGRQGTGGGEW
eukprot:CAMPEP_0117683442 /NCGR_PEP_ID=MMETSP0804-20121206/20398_1 /TAXON_ID=1074897 /ORGANISM="Tetraselmis astigmatica, Strain CCMP880" /LENGTH=368 /DNA_ID=CAMNT_0005494027 /DNA_START=37 /DNA_END=1140 /DNA_ORIENTATION=-